VVVKTWVGVGLEHRRADVQLKIRSGTFGTRVGYGKVYATVAPHLQTLGKHG
jgi:hypothetical protein